MRAVQVLSSRLRVPVIVAALLACSLGSAQAGVVFFETSSDAVINPVLGQEIQAHNFTVSQGGIYRATITNLSGSNPFYEAPFDSLKMQITNVSTTEFSATVGNPTGVDGVNFTALAAGSFAAVVQAMSGAGGTKSSGYQVRVTLIPEPAIWAMLAAGFGLLGFVRIRRTAHSI